MKTARAGTDWRDSVPRTLRRVVTPEGVPLEMTIAAAGDRVVAVGIDMLLQLLALVVTTLLLMLVSASFEEGWGIAALYLTWFLLRTFYFTFFELRWRGATPGKRLLGLRVIDAHGGALSSNAVLVRNLTRELEVFLPVVALLQADAYLSAHPLLALLAIPWMLIFGLMPLFNRERLRVGDMLAGTLVVRVPKAVLLPALRRTGERGGAPELRFTSDQLDLYGIYELQVLEELLRSREPSPRSLATVAEKVKRKLAWSGPEVSDEAFLRAFYEAQRGRLEGRMLLGERREHKRAGKLDRPAD